MPPAEPVGPNQAMIDCLEGVLYSVEQQSKTEFQVLSGGGEILANIDTFPTAAKAQKFEDQLIVDHVSGDNRVAVLLGEASDGDAAVIGDCLAK